MIHERLARKMIAKTIRFNIGEWFYFKTKKNEAAFSPVVLIEINNDLCNLEKG